MNIVYKITNVSGSLIVVGQGLLVRNFYMDMGVELLINNHIRKLLSAINLNDEDIWSYIYTYTSILIYIFCILNLKSKKKPFTD